MRRVDGYDEGFDYTGKDYVAAPAGLYGFGKRVPRDQAQRLGSKGAGEATASVLDKLQRTAGGASQAAGAMRVWRQLSDPRARTHVIGLYLREGRGVRELIAYVDAPVWVNDLTMRRASILPEWNHLCERHGLALQANRLTFKLSSRAHASALGGGPSAAGEAPAVTARPLVPLTPEERECIARVTAVITDDKLRKSASEAMEASLRCAKSNNRPNPS